MSWGRNQPPALMGMPRNANSEKSTDVGAAWALVTIRADASLKTSLTWNTFVPTINTSLVLPNPAHSEPKSAFRAVHTGPGPRGSCRPAFYCWGKEMSLFLLVTARSHRSVTSVLGECRASQPSASCLFFKDITRGLSFSQVCVRKSPSAARPGCCLDHASKYSLLPASSRHFHLCIPSPHWCSAEEKSSHPVGQHCSPRKTALCSQENSNVPPGEQCQHFPVSRSGTLPSPGRAGPAWKAFLTESCSTQLQMFPQHSTQCSKICIRTSFGEEEILREPLQIPEQIRHSAPELEKESESRSQSGEQKTPHICVCVESLVLDHGPTDEGP